MGRTRFGFTIVELLVVIAVIAVLATISVVGYGTWQRSLAVNALKSDLLQAKSAMKNARNFANTYPKSLIELQKSFSPSNDTLLSMSSKNELPHYSGLSTVQNGVLFYTICGDLISEGYAKGTNNGGQPETYISGCNVYNKNQLEVNSSWNGKNFTTPVSSSALPSAVASIHYNDDYRPNRDQLERDFYQSWHDRFQAEGGTYPITSFWDDWANDGNGGVKKQSLPNPDGTESRAGFCVQAISKRYTDIVWHITESDQPTKGNC